MNVAQQMLGPESPTVTLDVYQHPFGDPLGAVAHAMEPHGVRRGLGRETGQSHRPFQLSKERRRRRSDAEHDHQHGGSPQRQVCRAGQLRRLHSVRSGLCQWASRIPQGSTKMGFGCLAESARSVMPYASSCMAHRGQPPAGRVVTRPTKPNPLAHVALHPIPFARPSPKRTPPTLSAEIC